MKILRYTRKLMLLYIKRERNIRKSCIIYALEMGFVLSDRKNELVFSVSIKCTAKNIRKSNVYIALSINTYKSKSLCINISRLGIYCLLLIINELNIIYFRLLASIGKSLYKTRGVIYFLTILFGNLL